MLDYKIADRHVVLAIDVGGTKILVGYVGKDGTVYKQVRYPMDRTNQQTALDSIFSAVKSFTRNGWESPLAIGMGLVGHVDYINGIWLGAMNIPICEPVDIAARLSKIYGIPVLLDNDVHTATLAELCLGAGRKYKDFIYMNIGTGLSAGIVSDGRIIRGAGNYAGECGHIKVEFDGELCKCGNRGCLETIASGGGIIDVVHRMLPHYPTSKLHSLVENNMLFSKTIFEEADKGDELSKIIAERAVEGLGTGLVDLVNILNPEAVILGGGVVADGWLIDRVSDYIDKYALPIVKKYFKGLLPSRLDPNQVGLLGASSIAWEYIKKRKELNYE